MLRSGTSVGANYRAACRGKSTADILHKLFIVEEEADESLYWIELLIESKLVTEKKLWVLFNDINEIVAMTVASIKTLRSRKSVNPKSKIQNLKYERVDCFKYDAGSWPKSRDKAVGTLWFGGCSFSCAANRTGIAEA
ncbi:MAG: four helix bundle protein [Blastocatellia bacterium]